MTPRYVGYWRRFAATCLDSLVAWIALPIMLFSRAGGVAVAVAVVVAYFVYSHGSDTGQTWGKSAVGIAVRERTGLRRRGYRRAARRVAAQGAVVSVFLVANVALGPTLGGPVSMVGLAADVLWMYRSRERRTLHDVVSGSVVVALRNHDTDAVVVTPGAATRGSGAGHGGREPA